MVGLINEIEAENGFAWNARLIMFETWYASMGDAAEKNPMFNGYRYNPERVEEVRSTSRDFLDFQRWNQRAGHLHRHGDFQTDWPTLENR